jgi:BirA family biotin operon repressor/biotin-[acetyl-CoA-carboxylase] ligase
MIWRVEHFMEIDSTNTWLVKKANEGADEGLAAYADFQSNGHGRLDRRWESPTGTSLLCSVLLRPAIDVDQLQLVVAAVALAVRAALVRLCGVRPGLKWPNDLMVENRKLAGLLAEIVTTGDEWGVVVGFGVNLTSSPDPSTSTNVLEASGVRITPRALLDIVLEELEVRRDSLDSEVGRSALRDEYERALLTLGQVVRVETLNEVFVGEACRVDTHGRLVVDTEDGEMKFFVGDVVHLRAQDGAS